MRSTLLAPLVLSAALTAAASAQPPIPPIPPAPPGPVPAEPVPAEPGQLPPEPVPVEPLPEIRPDAVPAPPTPPAPAGEAVTGPLGPHWGDLEFILWWMKPGSAPPLLTANAAGRTPIPCRPGTVLLFGGGEFDPVVFGGVRMAFGRSLNADQTVGYEGVFFGLAERSDEFSALSSGLPRTPAIGRPFVDATTGRLAVLPVAVPGSESGGVRFTTTTSAVGAELNLVRNLFARDFTRGPDPDHLTHDVLHVNAVVGFRYFGLRDELRAEQLSTVFAAPRSPGPTLAGSTDQFNGDTDFYGGQVGLRADWHRGPYSLELAGKVALGGSAEVVKVNGATIVAAPAMFPTAQDAGLLAVSTNGGRYYRSALAFLPEATVRLGYALGDHTRITVGYNFLYLSNVVRAGNQVDPVVNPALVPLLAPAAAVDGPERPLFAFHRTDFWAQGIMIGLECRY
jgi:hypothetical protein